MRNATAAAFILCVAVAATACEARRRRTPDDTLVVVADTAMRSSDPRYAFNSYEAKLTRLVAPGLFTVDTPTLEPQPNLAEKIDRIDDVTWDVTLRPGLKFSNGTALTVDDVIWSFDTVIRDGSDSLFHKPFKERFKSLTAAGDRVVRFTLHKPLATLLGDLEFGIISRAAADKNGRYPGGRVVAAGPFRVVSIGDRAIVLERNDHFHGEPPRMKRIEIKIVTDATARILMMVGGSADLLQNGVRLDLIDDVARRERIAVTSGPSAILTYMMMNNTDPALSDVRVRRAIALAIDRPALVAAKFSGRARLADTLLPAAHWAHADGNPQYHHDAARARALLDEAGFRDPDGPGPQPRLRLTYKTSTDQFRVNLARIIAAQLGAVGIAVEVRPFEFATFFADIKKGNYQLGSMQTVDMADPDFYFTYFHSSRIPTKDYPDAGNRWRYKNARVDELTEAGRRELDREKRYALYAEAQRLVAEDVPIIPLWHEDNVVLAHRDVGGYLILPNARFAGLATAFKTRREQ